MSMSMEQFGNGDTNPFSPNENKTRPEDETRPLENREDRESRAEESIRKTFDEKLATVLERMGVVFEDVASRQQSF